VLATSSSRVYRPFYLHPPPVNSGSHVALALVATHVRQQYRFPFERRSILRPVPTKFLGGCSQCPSSGTATRNGGHVPSFTADDFSEINQVAVASSFEQFSKLPEYVCFGHWAPLNITTPVLQSLPTLRTLHITTLSNLEEFVWSKGASITTQAEVFIRYKAGRLPTSLRRLVFTWAESQKNNSRTYERKNLDDSRWSLLSDDWSRPSREVGKSIVPLIVKRHAEL
jgi:hypothetical protein